MAYRITDICNGCTLCQKLCPVEAINGEVKMPHTINEKRCVECGVCGWVCAQGAILDNNEIKIDKVPRKQWPKPVINHSACTACAICVDACGKDALRISPPTFKGDINVFAFLCNEKVCVGCGLCSKRCPMDAIKMEVRHD